MKRTATLALLTALSVVVPNIVFAQAVDVGKGMEMNEKVTTTAHHGVGVIKEINAATGVVTLDHGPIKSLNWPAMTMGFKVKDKTLLDNVKPGNKVDFTLVQAGKDYVITSIK